MTTSVMLMVLLGALLHASWNAVVKSGGDKLRQAGLVAGGASVVSLLLLPLVALPDRASWPWLAGSVVVHQLYYVLVAAAYRAGDMGHTYPLMRGAAPLIVALLSGPLIGEQLTTATAAGVALICGGILILALHRQASRTATFVALGNALVIALYTFVDGLGARASGQPVSYVLWLTFLTGPGLLAYLFWRDGGAMLRLIRERGAVGLAGGACSVGSYGFALYAMTMAPLAAVAALRETSVLFGVAIAALVLHEPAGMRRLIAAALVVAGAATLRLV
jgi:drug/metabolite transporter (DMT)-like permease